MEEKSISDLRERHMLLMGSMRKFSTLFGVSLTKFYSDIFTGFDILKFDEWLMQQDETYRKANDGGLGEEADCSMKQHIIQKYGQEAADLVRSYLRGKGE